MRRTAFCCALVGLIGAMGVAMAQNPGPNAPPPDPNTVKLVGDRFKPLTYREMTPEQKKMFESLLSGERRGAGGPFNVLLRSPEMGDLAQKFGASMRFHSTIPPAERAGDHHHRPPLDIALRVVRAHARRASGRSKRGDQSTPSRPAGVRRRCRRMKRSVYNFCTELLTNKQVSDQTFQAAKDKFGERGVVDLIGVRATTGSSPCC